MRESKLSEKMKKRIGGVSVTIASKKTEEYLFISEAKDRKTLFPKVIEFRHDDDKSSDHYHMQVLSNFYGQAIINYKKHKDVVFLGQTELRYSWEPKSVTIKYHNDTLDDVVIPFKLIEGDYEKFNEKKKLERKAEAAKAMQAVYQLKKQAMNISVSTGSDLVNIYVNPCSDDVEKTKITLYFCDGDDDRLVGKYELSKTEGFKSITGLAYGKYKFVISQFAKNNKLLVESDDIAFSIKDSSDNGNDKPVVRIG